MSSDQFTVYLAISLSDSDAMVRFIHSADWQLGARFSQFGGMGDVLREARLTTLRRAMEVARAHAVDAFLVAGDLFEDNQVEDRLVERVLGVFGEFDPLPVYILPGNHDPASGLDSVWCRKTFSRAPANVRVLRETAATPLGSGAVLLASPLKQKLSSTDPSLALDFLAAGTAPGKIRIGITHGALAIEGMHQPNDFPIALNAASRAGLDYLAIGHWHNWLSDTDGGRIVMPGTPEPDRFETTKSGHVALVEIEGPGAVPRVEPIPVATMQWRELDFDFVQPDASRVELESAFKELVQKADSTVIRLVMKGEAEPSALRDVKSWLDNHVAQFRIAQVVDRTTPVLGEAERGDLVDRHPMLAQVLADIDRLESLSTGTVSGAAASEVDATRLSLPEAQAILLEAKIELTELNPSFFATLRRLLYQRWQEVAE